jgi:hypothetical protein
MKESYILIDKSTKQIKKDDENGCLLIFDFKEDAVRFLNNVHKDDKKGVVIVSREMSFN